MSWKRLKTFAIAILLVMNAIFLFLILQRNYRATHYDRDLIDSAIAVFRKSELYVGRSILSEETVSLPVYTGIVENGTLREHTIIRAIESEGFRVIDEPGGLRCKNAVGEFYFGNDFGFYYSELGRYDRPSDLLATERYILLSSDHGAKESARNTVKNFLEKYRFLSQEEPESDYEIAYSKVYSSGVNHIVTLSQRIDGVPIHGNISFLVSGGRVVSADGILVTRMPESRQRAETVDVLNILFAEKAYLDAREDIIAPRIVSDVSYAYAVYFDADEKFYLIPLCKVSYVGGDVSVYNCVSGKLYS